MLTKAGPIKNLEMSRFLLVFFLPLNEVQYKVCKQFFIQTICIGAEQLKKMLNLKQSYRKEKTKIISNEEKKIFIWLKKIPLIVSHYCRRSSSKLYVNQEFESMTESFTEYTRYSFENDIPHTKKTKNVQLCKIKKICIYLFIYLLI